MATLLNQKVLRRQQVCTMYVYIYMQCKSQFKYRKYMYITHVNGVLTTLSITYITEALRTNRSIVRLFGVYLRPAAIKEFNLMENFDYEPGNSAILCAIRAKMDVFRLRHEFLVLKHLFDGDRLLSLPCRRGDVDRRVVQLAVGITDLPFHIIVSYLSA
jgi:hypothetical protein